MHAELLVHARAPEVFSIYLDPHYWNLHFNSIRQAYFDRSLAPGARGSVEIAGAGRWRTRVANLYDDSELVIRLRRLAFTLTFRLRIRRVNSELQRVSHTLIAGPLSIPFFLLYHRSINEWLTLSLYIVQAHAHKLRQERTTRRQSGKVSRRGKQRKQPQA